MILLNSIELFLTNNKLNLFSFYHANKEISDSLFERSVFWYTSSPDEQYCAKYQEKFSLVTNLHGNLIRHYLSKISLQSGKFTFERNQKHVPELFLFHVLYISISNSNCLQNIVRIIFIKIKMQVYRILPICVQNTTRILLTNGTEKIIKILKYSICKRDIIPRYCFCNDRNVIERCECLDCHAYEHDEIREF